MGRVDPDVFRLCPRRRGDGLLHAGNAGGQEHNELRRHDRGALALLQQQHADRGRIVDLAGEALQREQFHREADPCGPGAGI